ncbi:MAG TPA: histidine phosphatase family protein [Acidimicrobiales bacterium]|nr:histidine phosphatase family protein [Acidimicrobiales bacterium]
MKTPAGVEGVRRVWLIRHGESTWNEKGIVQGQLDPGLTRLGREQAARCARTLAEGMRAEALYSSDLRRALESAAPIAEALGLELQVEADLRERSLGDAEGSPNPTLGPARSGISEGRVVDADAAPAGGESVRQLYERAVTCARRVLSRHRGDVVLVCHGGVVRVLAAWLDGATPDGMTWPEVDNSVPIVRRVLSTSTCT